MSIREKRIGDVLYILESRDGYVRITALYKGKPVFTEKVKREHEDEFITYVHKKLFS